MGGGGVVGRVGRVKRGGGLLVEACEWVGYRGCELGVVGLRWASS